MKYRWCCPLDWLEEAAKEWDGPKLYQELISLATAVDSDTLQDHFEYEMDQDGYFEEVRVNEKG